VMNHAVVSLLNDGPAKVRCRTCHSDHDFRHEQPPPPKVDPRKGGGGGTGGSIPEQPPPPKVDPGKAALFNQVLGNVADAGQAELSLAGSAPVVVPVDGTPIPAATVSEDAIPAPAAKSKGRKKAQA
jgi:hypothetical protein